MTKRGIPKRDGSGRGISANKGRGGCKPIKRRGLKKVSMPGGRAGRLRRVR